MKTTLSILAVLTLFSSGFARERTARGVRPERGHVGLAHVGEGVQFKIRREDQQGLRGETEHDRINRIASAVGKAVEHLTAGSEPKRVFRHAGVNEQKHIDAGLHLWYKFDVAKKMENDELVKFAPQQRAVDAVQLLKKHPLLAKEFDVVETELKIRQSYVTDDPNLSIQNTNHYDLVKLAEAWDMTAGDSSVVVQVIDSGIDMTHPDLQVNQWSNTGETDCSDGIDNDNNGYIDDCQGYNHADDTGTDLEGDGSHGTHCAGTIAADNDNAVGVAGVAGGKNGDAGASLMINTVFGTTDTDGFADALIYGADNGAHISSNSWGYTIAGVYEQAVLDAMDYADDAGVVIVFAAGNDGTDEEWYPGYYDVAVAVAALDSSGVAAYFTCFGDWVDISAPGHPVYSTVLVADGSYDYMSGTSMACPHVAGGLALAKSYNPDVNSSVLKSCLYSSATDVDSLNTATYANNLGAGVMDIPALILCAAGLSPTPSPSVSPAPTYPVTFKPTSMPIVCGECSHTLTLVLTTDRFPTETSYSLTESTSSGGCFTSVSGPSSSLSASTTYSLTLSEALCSNTDYLFTISDSVYDGICCAYGEGSYYLQLDGTTIHTSDGDFGGFETVTVSTTFTPSAAPTMAPTSVSTCDDLGWTNAATYGETDVCGSSGTCGEKMTYSSAELYCENMGARLCTLSEILDDEPRGTGCGYDKKFVWTKTKCDDGYMIGKSSVSNSMPKCKSDMAKNRVRCCADVGDGVPVPAPTKAPTVTSSSSCADLGWTNAATYGDSLVCGNSMKADGDCSGKKKFKKAQNWCENQGARLCTLDELLNDEARATGCGADDDKVWSSTACSDGYYVAAGSSRYDLTECKPRNSKSIKTRCCADVVELD